MRSINTGFGIVIVLLLAGCGEGNLSVEGSLPSQMNVGRNASVTVDDGVLVRSGSTALEIERARMMLGELEIEGRTERSEFEVGPAVLEIGLNGDATEVAVASVPAGRYQELGFELARGAREDVDGSEDFGGGNPASIVVDGMFNGEPFTFRSSYVAELEFGLGGLRIRDGETATVTVTIDVASWFVDGGGSILDPSDPANQAAIDANLRRSVAAYAEEEDGDDDD